MHSVPRLMPGQGFIVGVGSIGYPAEFEGADPAALAQLGGEQGHHAHQHLRPPHHHRRRERRVPAPHPRAAARPGRVLRPGLRQPRRAVRAGALGTRTAAGSPTRPPSTRRSCRSTRSSTCTGCAATSSPTSTRSAGGRPTTHPELDITHHDLSIWDLDREFPIGNLGAGRLSRKVMPLRDILGVLRDAYARTVGVEYMHIQEPDQKEWIQEQVEGPPPARHRGGEAPHPRAAQRGRGVRALPAHQVPRAEALQPRRRGDARPDARRALHRRGRRGHEQRRPRHGAPRPAQRAGQRDRQVVRADLPRVRGRARSRDARRARAT